MRSFVKIKSSRIGDITLSFTVIGKSCPLRDFFTSQMCLLTLFAKIKFSRKFPNFSTFCRFQVAFNLAQMIDNGETVALRAGRTRTDFKWKGLIKYINRHLTELCLSKGAKNVVFVITDANPSAPVLFSSNLTHHLVTRVSTRDRRQSRTLFTIGERGSKKR